MTEYKLIPLTGKHGQGKYAIVDADEYVALMKYKWYWKAGYARRDTTLKGIRYRIYMHRAIMGEPGGFVDHINRDRLDNRKENLRVGTRTQNSLNNGGKKKKRGKYKGLHYDPRSGRWGAQISINGKQIHLGMHGTQEEAARTYDKAAIEHHGDWVRTNESLGLLR